MTSSLPTNKSCPVCGSDDVAEFVNVLDVPVYCNVLWATPDEALGAPRGDLRLGFCSGCTHIFNLAFDPALVTYGVDYENSLYFSPRFRSYAESLATHLVERYSLRGKTVVEIGCGNGDFLRLLCELGGCRGVGFDPALKDELAVPGETEPVRLFRGSYGEGHADLGASLVCCRQVLEHLSTPRDLLATVRSSAADPTHSAVFFEVPNALFTLRDKGIWDLIYEHVSYFTPNSLARSFALVGLEVRDLGEAYDGQYLCIEASAGVADLAPAKGTVDPDQIAALVKDFAREHNRIVESWRRDLAELRSEGRTAAIWGAGSKGVTFLNVVKAGGAITRVVDISPRKHGRFVPGSDLQVVAPEALRQSPPDVILVMNPIYRDEIEQQVRQLGLTSILRSV